MRRASLLPVVFATYSLAYLDRANFGFGAAAGLAQTLGITESRTALLGALFFLGYFAFQIPGHAVGTSRQPHASGVCRVACVGRTGGADGSHSQLCVAGGGPSAAGRCGEHRLSRDAAAAHTVVYARGTVACQHHPDARQPDHGALDVRDDGLPDSALRLAAHVHLEGLPAMLWAFVWLRTMRDGPRHASWMPTAEADALEAAIHADQPRVLPQA